MAVPSGTFSYPDSLDITERLAYGVGALVMQWSACEGVFYGILETLVGRANTGVGVIVWFSFRSNRDRLSLITRLAKANDTSDAARSEVASVCKQFRAVTKVRNFYCHAEYRTDTHGWVTHVAGHQLTEDDEPLHAQVRPVTKGLLNEIAHAIRAADALSTDAARLLVRLQSELKVTQPKLPPELLEFLSKADPPSRP